MWKCKTIIKRIDNMSIIAKAMSQIDSPLKKRKKTHGDEPLAKINRPCVDNQNLYP